MDALTVVQTINSYLSNYVLIVLLIGTACFSPFARASAGSLLRRRREKAFGTFSLKGGKQKAA